MTASSISMKEYKKNENIRNIAIIAHVDHGKTTLIDHLLRQSGAFHSRSTVEDRVMDNLDLERERGITIAAKNCSLLFEDVKINVIDTPGHADFGGEVERALQMVDGAILLVDASEGPLPQTRFVLKKALESNLSIIVVINKVDRQDARPGEVLDEVFDLLIDLDATEEQLEVPVFYAISRDGKASEKLEDLGDTLEPLLTAIVNEIPPPEFRADKPFQMLVSNLSYSDYLGRLAIGRVVNGEARKNDQLVCLQKNDASSPLKVSSLQVYHGLKLHPVETAEAGDIVILAGVENVEIGDTICTQSAPSALKRISVDEPTIAMLFTINSSPLAGTEGTYVQSRKILERLHKETLHNVALRLQAETRSDSFLLEGRGEFQMAILIETMRREGYEFSVGRPQILFKEKDDKRLEPIEHLFVDCEEAFIGVVTEKLAIRKARLLNLVNHGSGRARFEFSVPTRGLIGYRNEFLTDTRGTGILNSYLLGYEEFRGDFPQRTNGSLVSDRQGVAIPYALFHLEPRGTLFVRPGEKVYEGMIIGENSRDNDLNVNPCKTKKLSNVRASGKDDAILLAPVQQLTLEHSIEFIRDDELIEVTPKSIRLRKRILQANQRSVRPNA